VVPLREQLEGPPQRDLHEGRLRVLEEQLGQPDRPRAPLGLALENLSAARIFGAEILPALAMERALDSDVARRRFQREEDVGFGKSGTRRPRWAARARPTGPAPPASMPAGAAWSEGALQWTSCVFLLCAPSTDPMLGRHEARQEEYGGSDFRPADVCRTRGSH
jgi:hypothetical protein